MAHWPTCTAITVRDLANLSADAYSNTVTSRAGGWSVQRRHLGDPSGFAAAVYRRRRQVVVAFRGTELSDRKDVLRDDVDIALSRESPQMRTAAALADTLMQSAADREVWLTGHSLGGALATFAALSAGLPAATFNAPTMGKIVGAMSHVRCTAPIHNFVYGHDAVSGVTRFASPQMGRTIHVPTRRTVPPAAIVGIPFFVALTVKNAIADHGLQNFLDYLDANPGKANLPPDRWQ